MHTPDERRDDACAPGDGEFNADLERLVVVDGSKWKFYFRNFLHLKPSMLKYFFYFSY